MTGIKYDMKPQEATMAAGQMFTSKTRGWEPEEWFVVFYVEGRQKGVAQKLPSNYFDFFNAGGAIRLNLNWEANLQMGLRNIQLTMWLSTIQKLDIYCWFILNRIYQIVLFLTKFICKKKMPDSDLHWAKNTG